MTGGFRDDSPRDPSGGFVPPETEPDDELVKPAPLSTGMLIADDWGHRFFEHYMNEGRQAVMASVKFAGVTKSVFYKRLDDDGLFASLKADADQIWAEAVEQEIKRRIFEGVQRPVYQRGHVVGHVREFDTKLLIWFAERLMPEKYNLAQMTEQAGDAPIRFGFPMGEADTLEIEPGEIEESE